MIHIEPLEWSDESIVQHVQSSGEHELNAQSIDEYELNVIEWGTKCSNQSQSAGSEKQIVLLDPIMFQNRLMAPIPGRNKSLFLPKADSNADSDAYDQNTKETLYYPCYGDCSKQKFNAGAANQVKLRCHALQSWFIKDKIILSKTDSDADSDIHDQNAGQQLLQKYYWILYWSKRSDE